MKLARWLAAAVLGCCVSAVHADDGRTLMRFPTLHGDTVVFEAHGNLWEVARGGGTARRLTSEPGYELMPRYSPDGRWIAFTGQYQGNRDVYVMPAGGGEPQRLTHHSDVVDEAPQRWGPDNMVVTWTPDSKNIVFLSRRDSWNSWFGRLYTVPVTGGFQTPLPLDRGGFLSYSPDGRRIVYNRIFQNFRTWKRYDGGLAQDLDLYDFETKQLTHLTDWTGGETSPMWVGHVVYFLADHDPKRRMNLWALDLDTHQFRQVTTFTDYDVDYPSLGDTGITFQQGGHLWVMDLPSESIHALDVRVPDDGTHTRPRFTDASKVLRTVDAAQQPDYDLAPNGKRVAFSARGELFTAPVEHGDSRNLTETTGVDEDHPAWSPDGRWLAYTTDVGGEQQVAITPSAGGDERLLTHFKSGFLYQPVWSPGGDRLAFSDTENRLWIVGVDGGEARQVAQDPYNEIHDYSWSPDGRWLAYSLGADNHVSAIWLYSVESGKATRVSRGRDQDFGPVFDPDGEFLAFVSSRHENVVISDAEFDVATLKSTGIYLAPLAADAPSPFAPQSDEGVFEAAKGRSHGDRKGHGDPADHDDGDGGEGSDDDEHPPWKPGASKPVRIDLAGLMDRAVPMPVPASSIAGIELRGDKVFWYTTPIHTIEGENLPGESSTLHVFDLTKRKDAVVIDGVDSFRVSADGRKVLYQKEKDFFVVDAKPADERGKDDDGKDDRKQIDLSHFRVRIDPRAEWREMYANAWRLERDVLFSREMNGVDWKAVRAQYEKLLPLAGSREDLNYLVGEMIGELSNSHTYVGGGDQDDPVEKVPTGVLGVDFALDRASGRYRFAKIYGGDNTREAYRGPLAQPGLNVHEGDVLLAVDGEELKAPADPYSLFVGKEDGQILLTIADSPGGKRRDIVVEPVKNELNLREVEWIEHNRAMVDRLSGGKVAYVYLSDMDQLGMQQFVRQFYNQIDKQALIVDDRWNGGGFIDQIVLERVRRVLIGMETNRQRVANTIPNQLISGPKACLINHYSASDGDIFPFFFRKYGLGPLIGTRTWGGVRGIRGYWPLLDGGYVTIPEASTYGLDSQWNMENVGVSPDMPVDDSPADWMAGRDPQLEAGVTYLLGQLKGASSNRPPAPPLLPAYPSGGHE